ncbi:MAG TPA: hypothetical protein VKA26_00980 [Ignavibacteriaceae bacterium]|nr:hypothetical protein [Ignavibacteriaceae bacterium]
MIKQDYIMKMIEQFVNALAKILFNKEAGNYKEAINDIEGTLNNLVGVDHFLINTLSGKDIISLLNITKDSKKANIQCIIIAKLLKEKAELNSLSKKDKSIPDIDYQKSLSLFLEGILNYKADDIDLSKYYNDVNEIVHRINDSKISKDTRFKLFKYYEQLGEYKKAGIELNKLKNIDFLGIENEEIQFHRKLNEQKAEET